jgi:hypothetical protein
MLWQIPHRPESPWRAVILQQDARVIDVGAATVPRLWAKRLGSVQAAYHRRKCNHEGPSDMHVIPRWMMGMASSVLAGAAAGATPRRLRIKHGLSRIALSVCGPGPWREKWRLVASGLAHESYLGDAGDSSVPVPGPGALTGDILVAILEAPGKGEPQSPAEANSFSPAYPGRPYLVFIRAGGESWHQRLIAENPDRNWDCCVSWYTEPAEENLAEYYCGGATGGFSNKLDGFLEFWGHRPRPWSYRYVLMLDDDLYLGPGELSRFFQLCDFYNLYLAQPSLRWFTHTTLNALVRNPVCLLRRVAFVEIMAPCFSGAALDNLIHTFSWTRSTWGIDWAWGGMLQGQASVHVVDAVSMEHTRTGGGRPTAFYRKLQAAGIDPGADLRRMQTMFPDFHGSQTLSSGHVFRPNVPRSLAPGLMLLFERLKFIVRARKQFLRNWRVWRARVEDVTARALATRSR